MKQSLTTVAKGLFASVLLGSMAYAVPTITLTQGNITESPQLNGGEFTAYSATLSNASYAVSARNVNVAGSFETFCMAYDQDFSYGQTLAYALTNHTDDFSAGTITGLTSGVAYLYSQFAQGIIQFADEPLVTASNKNTGFQLAIWTLQHSAGAPSIASFTGGVVDAYNLYMGIANANGGSAIAGANNFGVQVILTGYGSYNSSTDSFTTPNSYHGQGWEQGYSQPQLYYSVPDAGTTVTLLGLSLLGIAGFRRKMSAGK